MTLTYFKDYQELFAGQVPYYDGSLTSDGKLQDINSGYHGTIIGATRTGTNRFGIANKCMVFDGTDDYVNTGYVLGTVSNRTITIWFKHTEDRVDASRTIIFGKSASDGGFPYFKIYHNTSNEYALTVRQSAALPTEYTVVIPSTNFTLNSWYMITGSMGTRGLEIYLNGALINSNNAVTFVPVITTNPLVIGASMSTNGTTISDYCKAEIGEVLINSTQPTPEVIKSLYNLTKSKYLFPVQSGIRAVE